MSQFKLLKQRRFAPLFWTQFLGAFNDNFFKNAFLILVTFGGLHASLKQDSTGFMSLAQGLFILPFFLFSSIAGQWAEKNEKSRLIRKLKVLEIIIMVLAAIGFWLKNPVLLLLVLFLLGMQSAFFGPMKYSILPQHLDSEELLGGNGLVEMGTFVAILLGTILGGILVGIGEIGIYAIMGLGLIVALMGWYQSRKIPKASPTNRGLKINWNFLKDTLRLYRLAKENDAVHKSILGLSWFWLFGATVLTILPNFTKLSLGAGDSVLTWFLALFCIGIGMGSLLCEKLSGGRIELGLVPFGSIGMVVLALDLFWVSHDYAISNPSSLIGFKEFISQPGSIRLSLDLFFMSLFGGFYTVPLYALIQERAKPEHRSQTIAANNIISSLFIVIGSGVTFILVKIVGVSLPKIFLILGLMHAAISYYIYHLIPEFFLRFAVWILIHTVYRVKVEGLEKIPREGPYVLICNHVTYVDAFIISSAVRRYMRFVMYYKYFDMPVLNYFSRKSKTIPIAAAKERPRILKKAFEEIDQTLKEGDLICIFPEGKLTSNGKMNEFKNGIETIVKQTPVPVIPMALTGLWESYFARNPKQKLWGIFPKRFSLLVTLKIGDPVAPEDVDKDDLYQRVKALMD